MVLGLAERIEAVLALAPEKGAIEYNGTWHTWGQLKGAMSRIDAILMDAGLGAGAPIGIILRNRAAHLPALLQVLVSQRCVVTINPFQRPEKLAADIRHLRLPALIADAQDWSTPEIAQAAGEAGCVAIRIEDAPTLGATLLNSPDHFRKTVSTHVGMEGTCILMLTSGTTGPAKRIKLPYQNFANAIFDAEYYENKGATPELKLKDSVAVLATPLVHIGGMYAAVAAVAAGRPIAIVEKFSVPEMRRIMQAYRPKLLALPPTALRMILDAEVAKEELGSLLAIRTGSAPLDPALQERFESYYGVPLLDAYGATEFAGAVAGWSLGDHRKYAALKRGSVGRAHPGCELRVVDAETFLPLPACTVGLLEVKTRQLDPDSWVRTTDLAEIDADGFLYIRGRADDAIVRGGFKVLPRDVEAVFRKHPAVKDASVVGLPDSRLGAVPAVAIELRDECAGITAEELLEFARLDLVSYQVPVHAKIVAALPRTPSLKVSQHEVKGLFEAELQQSPS